MPAVPQKDNIPIRSLQPSLKLINLKLGITQQWSMKQSTTSMKYRNPKKKYFKNISQIQTEILPGQQNRFLMKKAMQVSVITETIVTFDFMLHFRGSIGMSYLTSRETSTSR